MIAVFKKRSLSTRIFVFTGILGATLVRNSYSSDSPDLITEHSASPGVFVSSEGHGGLTFAASIERKRSVPAEDGEWSRIAAFEDLQPCDFSNVNCSDRWLALDPSLESRVRADLSSGRTGDYARFKLGTFSLKSNRTQVLPSPERRDTTQFEKEVRILPVAIHLEENEAMEYQKLGVTLSPASIRFSTQLPRETELCLGAEAGLVGGHLEIQGVERSLGAQVALLGKLSTEISGLTLSHESELEYTTASRGHQSLAQVAYAGQFKAEKPMTKKGPKIGVSYTFHGDHSQSYDRRTQTQPTREESAFSDWRTYRSPIASPPSPTETLTANTPPLSEKRDQTIRTHVFSLHGKF
jgi:hypothetical protein